MQRALSPPGGQILLDLHGAREFQSTIKEVGLPSIPLEIEIVIIVLRVILKKGKRK